MSGGQTFDINDLNAGRRKSRSFREEEEPQGKDNRQGNPAPAPPRKEPSPSSDSKPQEVRSGMLTNKEVKALKLGLDMAVPSRDKDQLKEEEEERRAADLEKKKRASQAKLPSSIGTDPPMKRFKILLLGDSGVGKTSLIFRWTMDTFNPSLGSTVGVDFKAKKVNIDGENVQIQVWDTSGQEQFRKITQSYYRGAQGIMLVCDVSDKKTIENITGWMENIIKNATDSIRVVLVGNKTDLRDEIKKNSAAENGGNITAAQQDLEEKAKQVVEIADKFNVPYIEASAKDSSGVNDAFTSLVNLMIGNDIGGGKKMATRGGDKTGSGKSGKSGKCVIS